MKKLFALTGMFLILVFSGCQENQLTQPDATLDKVLDIPPGDWLKIFCPVVDPTYGMCGVDGKVYYKITSITGAFPITVVQKSARVRLMLKIDATLCDLKNPTDRWAVYGNSEDEFVFTQDGIITIAKSYTISNRNDVVLRVVYNVTVNGVSINKVFLRKI